jgi:hypothetical protein
LRASSPTWRGQGCCKTPERYQVAAIIGNQEIRTALYRGGNDWVVLDVGGHLVEILQQARHDFRDLPKRSNDCVDLIARKVAQFADARIREGGFNRLTQQLV